MPAGTHTVSEQRITASAASVARFKVRQTCHTVWHQMVPAPVESAVQSELDGLTDERPGLAQVALALARLLDNPKAVSSQPAAAKVLTALLDKLHAASARGRRGGLALVRTMTEKGGA